MNYVVFDLEWNQPQDGKSADERRLAFEIIEIGAVKLNDELQIIDQYDQLIRPQVYQEINWRIRKMLDLKRGELSSGRLQQSSFDGAGRIPSGAPGEARIFPSCAET